MYHPMMSSHATSHRHEDVLPTTSNDVNGTNVMSPAHPLNYR